MTARIFWTLLFLGVCIGWLVLSYRPQPLAGVEMAFGPTATPIFLWLFAGSALLFVVIQVILVVSVRTFPLRIARSDTNPEDEEAASDREIRIFPGAEYFWTALPLLISIVFFWAIWHFLSL